MHRQAGDSHISHPHENGFRDPAVQILELAAGSGVDIPSNLIMGFLDPLQQRENAGTGQRKLLLLGGGFKGLPEPLGEFTLGLCIDR